MSAVRARLLPVLQPVVAGTGVELEDVTVTAAGRRSVVRVVVDRDGGVSLDDVADVSHVVSEALDALDARDPSVLGGSYVLEVTSPGVDRPLTTARHWRRARGRRVSAVLRDGDSLTGRVVSADDAGADDAGADDAGADDAGIVLDVDGVTRTLAYRDLTRGVVQVEFTRTVAAEGEEPA